MKIFEFGVSFEREDGNYIKDNETLIPASYIETGARGIIVANDYSSAAGKIVDMFGDELIAITMLRHIADDYFYTYEDDPDNGKIVDDFVKLVKEEYIW